MSGAYRVPMAAPDIRPEDIELVTRALASGTLSGGPYLDQLETAFAAYLRAKAERLLMSEERARFNEILYRAGWAIGLLVALAFGIPALAWYREHALLRRTTELTRGT